MKISMSKAILIGSVLIALAIWFRADAHLFSTEAKADVAGMDAYDLMSITISSGRCRVSLRIVMSMLVWMWVSRGMIAMVIAISSMPMLTLRYLADGMDISIGQRHVILHRLSRSLYLMKRTCTL